MDLRRQHEALKAELCQAFEAAIDNAQFVLGAEVEAFENDFAQFCGVAHGIGVNSGTSALQLALIAAGVGPGDEVITVPLTFVATVAAVTYTGARPVLVDVDPGHLTMNSEKIESAITPRTKVILPVHLHGHPADMDPILDVARKHGLLVIEDSAQAHDAEYNGRRIGSIGDMACFSFYPAKNLGACGEAGMVVTDNREFADVIRMYRDWGQRTKYHHDLPGFNFRMDAIQAAVLNIKLGRLRHWTDERRRIAQAYTRRLQQTEVATPHEASWAKHVYHVYAVRTQERDALQTQLSAREIQTAIHYPIPVHLQKAYRDLGYNRGDFPHSELAANQLLSLPMFAELTAEEVEEVATTVTALCHPLTSA